MSEYISRNEAHQELHQAGGCDASDEWARGYDAGITEAIDIIDNISPADVAPVVHGHWIAIAADVYRCSNCDQLVRTKDIVPYLFCNVCGAKMDESEDNNNV